jgi:predicted PurR-regulated permease PerM
MSRWISLILLLAVIAVTAAVLYRVMAAFLLPLFLASVLTVIFRPLHVRIVRRWPQRPTTSALVTTLLILLTVLLPVAGITTLAIREGFGAIGGNVLDRAEVRVARLREKWNLDLPFRGLAGPEGDGATSLSEIDQLVQSLPLSLPDFEDANNTRELQRHLDELFVGLQRLNQRLDEVAAAAAKDDEPKDDTSDMTRVKRLLETSKFEPVRRSLREMETTAQLANQYLIGGPQALPSNRPVERSEESRAVAPDTTDRSLSADEATEEPVAISAAELRRRYRRFQASFAAARMDLMGGPFWSWLTDRVNPTATQLDSLRVNAQRWLRNLLPSVAGQATAIVGGSLLGLAIMSLGVFYFLKDGPAMMQSLMSLSPLEDRYERQLVTEFESMSRAVVLATLLSAVAQAFLAGIAYVAAGFDSVFLLIMLTFIFAMVPFIGAAAVWFPACLWLAVVDERILAAVLLGLYCVSVVSMADNLIKPYVLHGRSNLHPLLALLSVLGGVQALGPIGILVGPMVVSFLQALLNILNNELKSFDKAAAAR